MGDLRRRSSRSPPCSPRLWTVSPVRSGMKSPRSTTRPYERVGRGSKNRRSPSPRGMIAMHVPNDDDLESMCVDSVWDIGVDVDIDTNRGGGWATSGLTRQELEAIGKKPILPCARPAVMETESIPVDPSPDTQNYSTTTANQASPYSVTCQQDQRLVCTWGTPEGECKSTHEWLKCGRILEMSLARKEMAQPMDASMEESIESNVCEPLNSLSGSEAPELGLGESQPCDTDMEKMDEVDDGLWPEAAVVSTLLGPKLPGSFTYADEDLPELSTIFPKEHEMREPIDTGS